jgi:hypothetical protein
MIKLTHARVTAATVLFGAHVLKPSMEGEIVYYDWDARKKFYEIRLVNNCFTPRTLREVKLHCRLRGEVPLKHLEDLNKTITVRDNQLSNVWLEPAPFSWFDELQLYKALGEIESISTAERQILKAKINGDQYYLQVTYSSLWGGNLTREVPLHWRPTSLGNETGEYF